MTQLSRRAPVPPPDGRTENPRWRRRRSDRERDRGNGIRRGPEPRIRVLTSDVVSACSLAELDPLATRITLLVRSRIPNNIFVSVIGLSRGDRGRTAYYAVHRTRFPGRGPSLDVALTWRSAGVAFVLQIQDTLHFPVELTHRSLSSTVLPAAPRRPLPAA